MTIDNYHNYSLFWVSPLGISQAVGFFISQEATSLL